MTPETICAGAEDAGKRLDAFLAGQIEELTRSAAARLCEEGRVRLGEKPLAKNYRLTCLLYTSILHGGTRPFRIVYNKVSLSRTRRDRRFAVSYTHLDVYKRQVMK